MRNPIAFGLADNLPAQFKADYPKFHSLLYKFYTWLDTEDNFLWALTSLADYLEVNNETDYYSDLILSELGWDNSLDIKISKKLLVSTLRDFYLSRGTFWSYKYLFRVLFGETVELSYPREKLFKPSSSVYSRDHWILTTASSFGSDSFNTITDQRITTTRIITGVTSKAKTNCNVVTPTLLAGNLYLLILINDANAKFTSNEYVDIQYGSIFIRERIYNSVSFSIITPGHGYNEGDVVSVSPKSGFSVIGEARVKSTKSGSISGITIVSGGVDYAVGDIIQGGLDKTGSGFLATVKNIDSSTGAITNVKIWSEGYFYSKIPPLSIKSKYGRNAVLQGISTSVGGIDSIEITESFWGSTGNPIATIISSTGTGAVIKVNSSESINSSASTHKDSQGFLGINSILHDSWYWQEYSYEIKSAVNRNRFDKVLLEYVHPVGTVCHSVYEKITTPTLNLLLEPEVTFIRNSPSILTHVDSTFSFDSTIVLEALFERPLRSDTLIGTINSIDPFKFDSQFIAPISFVNQCRMDEIHTVRLNLALPAEITQEPIV